MKKGPHQRSKQIINSPSINRPDSRANGSRIQNKQYMSPVRHFQGHPFAQVRAEYPSGRYLGPQVFECRGNTPGRNDNSRYYFPRESETEYIPTEHISALEERLKNIHDHYKKMISDQKMRNTEKSDVIMGLLEEMQTTHAKKTQEMRKMIEDSEEQKKEVGEVDDKMNEIKGNIEELIEQSNVLKVKNSELEKKISQKNKINETKEKEMEDLQQQLLDSRTELEQFELANLRNNKINREIMDIFNSASTIASE